MTNASGSERLTNVQALYPLTPMQSLMLLHTQALSHDTLVSQVEYRLEGQLDVDSFESAWRDAVARHPALRTAFLSEDLPKPIQVVMTSVPFDLIRTDLSTLEEADRLRKMEQLRSVDRRPFDVRKPPLMRARLIGVDPTRHVLIWTVHHLIMDRWSQEILFEDLRDHYRWRSGGPRPDLEPPPAFQDYVEWVRAQDRTRMLQHWGPRLRDAPDPRIWGKSRNAGSRQRRHWISVIGVEDSERLRLLAEASRSSFASLVLCGIAAAAGRFSGRRDVLFGLTSSGRTPAVEDVDRIVGSLVGNVPFRWAMEPDITLEKALAHIGLNLADGRFDHAPPSELRRLSGLPTDTPLFDFLVVLNLEESRESDWGGVVAHPVSGTLDAGYPGVLGVSTREGRLTLELVGDEDLDGDGFLHQLRHVLESLAALDPSSSLSPLIGEIPRVQEDALEIADEDRILEVLRDIPGVRDAAVAPGDPPAAYLVPNRSADLRPGKIRRDLEAKLPPPSVPQSINFLMELPLAPDGSVDLEALPPPAPPAYDAGRVPPSTTEEVVVHRVWSEVLGINGLSIDEDFFHIGGTSIQMLQISAELEDELHVPVPATLLLRHSTIREMAARIGNRPPASQVDKGSLVPIQVGADLAPLFMVHGRDGGVLFARFIAKHLDPDQPVWGIQAFGGRLGDMEEVSIEALAGQYLDEVRPHIGGRPLLLGGYSLGGLLAFEMARQADALGLSVEALVLLEPLLSEERPDSGTRPIRDRLRRALRLAGTTKEALRPGEENLPEAAKRELIQFRRLLPPAVRLYKPRPLDVPIIYYASVGEGERRRREWEPLARGGFDLVELPARHSHIIAEPVVGVLGRDLRARLAREGAISE